MIINKILVLAICLVTLTTSCSLFTRDITEITEFRMKEATGTAIVANEELECKVIEVSIVGGCVSILSVEELFNLVIATGKEEHFFTKISKRSGMFCVPNKADITTVWVSTVTNKVYKYDFISVSAVAQE